MRIHVVEHVSDIQLDFERAAGRQLQNVPGTDRSRVVWSDLLLAAGVVIMGCVAIRNLALFALFALPLLAGQGALLFGPKLAALELRMRVVGLVCLAGLGAFVATCDLKQVRLWNWGRFGLGVEEGNHAAAEFFRTCGVRGPVFNNFDVGGYLIFHVFPGERVFVDNRPEAYPAEFFREVYWPMLRDRDAWARREKEYGFNALFFTHADMSPTTQQFLIDRLRDPDWAAVFCDVYNVIFVRRDARNAEVIARASSPIDARQPLPPAR